MELRKGSIEFIENFLPQTFYNELVELFAANNFPWFYLDDTTFNKYEPVGQDRLRPPKPTNKNNVVVNPFLVDLNIKGVSVKDTTSFTHIFYAEGKSNSLLWNPVQPLVYFLESQGINFTKLIRARAGLLLPQPGFKKGDCNIPHIDHSHIEYNNFISILYYINDADGETFVFDQNNRDGVPTEVTIKEKYPHRGNSVLIFDGFQYHSSSNPITSKQRININLTFEI